MEQTTILLASFAAIFFLTYAFVWMIQKKGKAKVREILRMADGPAVEKTYSDYARNIKDDFIDTD